MKQRAVITLILLSIIISSCKEEIQKAADVFVKPTAREVYERNFSISDSLVLRSNNAVETAKRASLQISLPYPDSGFFPVEYFLVYSHNIQVEEGERSMVEVEEQADSAFVFVDLFRRIT